MGFAINDQNKRRKNFRLWRQFNNSKLNLDELALIIPGVLHINNRKDLSFEYLSKRGCELIGYSNEELRKNGSKILEKHQSTFTREIVHPKVLSELNGSSNEKEVLFYQDWKFRGKTPFIFLTTTKILNRNQFLSVSFFSKNTSYLTPNVNSIFKLNKIFRRYYFGYKSLTRREKEILTLLGFEFSRKEIAQKLFLSEGTVKKHCENIYRKLGTHKRIELEKISKIQFVRNF